MLDNDVVRQTVEDIVRRCLSSDRISRVEVQDDWDHDGDPVLRITVVFKSAPSVRDARKMIGLIGDLRSQLKQLDEESFPLVNFISKSEAAKLQFATA